MGNKRRKCFFFSTRILPPFPRPSPRVEKRSRGVFLFSLKSCYSAQKKKTSKKKKFKLKMSSKLRHSFFFNCQKNPNKMKTKIQKKKFETKCFFFPLFFFLRWDSSFRGSFFFFFRFICCFRSLF